MKNFIGFNSDIIAGEVIREEICEIATSKSVGMYRIEYFTKYYNVDELRNKLLNNKDKNKTESANINEKISEKENNEESKDNKGDEKEKKEKSKDTKDVEQENKEEDRDKKEEEKDKKEEEKDSKEEEKENKEEENKDEKLEFSNNNKNGKENEDEKSKNKGKEKIETEIEEDLDNKSTNKKYDVSQVNESSLIYKKFRNGIESYVLEDNSIKDKNKVKSTLIRYIFVNESHYDKEFKAILKSKSLSHLKKLNFFSPEEIFDEVKEKDISNFNNLYRLRADLPFLKKDSIIINIDLNN